MAKSKPKAVAKAGDPSNDKTAEEMVTAVMRDPAADEAKKIKKLKKISK